MRSLLTASAVTATPRGAAAGGSGRAGAGSGCSGAVALQTPSPPLQPLTTATLVGFYTLLNTSRLQEPLYSFSSLRSLALGLVILMASWAALSTMILRFLEETL